MNLADDKKARDLLWDSGGEKEGGRGWEHTVLPEMEQGFPHSTAF